MPAHASAIIETCSLRCRCQIDLFYYFASDFYIFAFFSILTLRLHGLNSYVYLPPVFGFRYILHSVTLTGKACSYVKKLNILCFSHKQNFALRIIATLQCELSENGNRKSVYLFSLREMYFYNINYLELKIQLSC